MEYIQFTPEQITQARNTNLYEYMLKHHPNDVQKCGYGVIQLNAHDSLKIKQGWTGYYRHSSGEHGDAIRFLQEYYGLSFKETVIELLGSSCHISSFSQISDRDSLDSKNNYIPFKKEGAFKNVMAYLCSRGISAQTINKLVEENLLYQDTRNNAVFVQKNKVFAELKGTFTYGDKAFKQTINLIKDKSLYWSFGIGEPQRRKIAYITESSIDAVSLYELHKLSGINEAADYCSCAGIGRNDAIAQIIKDHQNSIIAVDNDEAGNKCALSYPELKRIIPVNKDWNEDLLSLQNRKNTFTKEGM